MKLLSFFFFENPINSFSTSKHLFELWPNFQFMFWFAKLYLQPHFYRCRVWLCVCRIVASVPRSIRPHSKCYPMVECKQYHPIVFPIFEVIQNVVLGNCRNLKFEKTKTVINFELFRIRFDSKRMQYSIYTNWKVNKINDNHFIRWCRK